MDNSEIVKTIILGLPNFLGLLVALYFMREQNKALVELLKDCEDRKNPVSTE